MTTEHLTGIPRLRAAVLEAIDHPAGVLIPEAGQQHDEPDVAFACRAAMQLIMAVVATEAAEHALTNWRPTGFRNQPATITSEDS